MDKKLMKIIEPGIRLSFVILVGFALYSFTISPIVGAIELAIVAMLYIYHRIGAKKRSENVGAYVENLIFKVDNVSKNSLLDFPLPLAILQIDTAEIIWGNESLIEVFGFKDRVYGTIMTEAVNGFDTRWLTEGRTECPYEVEVRGKKYKINGNIVHSMKDDSRTLLATLYLTDVTEFADLRKQYADSRPIVSIIMLDNYEELMKNISESEKSQIAAKVEKHIMDWGEKVDGIVRKLDRDRYLFLFENIGLELYTEEKFNVIETVRDIKNSEGMSASLSLGIGKDGENFSKLYKFALIAMDMALSRGGDQAVIKTPTTFEFFGGKAREIEKRTKVKSRVVANSLKQLISEASNVFIMGHKFSDLDSLGSAAGLCAMVRKLGKKPYIAIDQKATSAGGLIEKLAALEEYENTFVDYDGVMLHSGSNSLLIVVDTNRPDMVEYPDVLTTIPRIALIDHHRRAADYIDNTAVSMHEPYASSTCELVAELMQYVMTNQELTRTEAEALLAGIYLDTKGFTVKTGVRTFEAAAQLKQAGADMLAVKHLFYNDFDSYVKKYQIISSADEVVTGISGTYTDNITERAIAAQAADELINIKGIKASFVVFAEPGGVCVSARSYGQVNVQLIMEKIGGGGSLTMAGAQFGTQHTPGEVFELVKKAAVEYLEENQK